MVTYSGLRRQAGSPVRGRYAPSPTARLHLGNARTALVAWLSVRAKGGTFILRIEDLDAPRVLAGAEREALEDLAWMGLDWDEGPDVGGSHSSYRQSERTQQYGKALRVLYEADRIFPCTRSRKDLQELASAPHGSDGNPYPRELRPHSLPTGWFDGFAASRDAAIRFMVEEEPVSFEDLVLGPQAEDVPARVGDFVLYRRDGVYAYQLAVVVDDLAMGITEVVRGRDLLDSTARQIQLIHALGASHPRYGHVPLVLNDRGEKLSKRDAGMTVASVRDAGVDAPRFCGYLAHSLGLLPDPRPATPKELIALFSWEHIRRGDFQLPPDTIGEIRRVSHGV